MSSQITTTFLIAGSEVEASVRASALSGAVYFAKCDVVCNTPLLIGSYVGGDKHLFVEVDMPNGTTVVALTGETGTVHDKKTTIELSRPLKTGQQIGVSVDTPTCKTKSCTVLVGELAATDCEIRYETPAAGTLTGEMICDGIDLYRLVFDGDGGKYPGVLVQENCIYCGGALPNCTEGEDPTGGDGTLVIERNITQYNSSAYAVVTSDQTGNYMGFGNYDEHALFTGLSIPTPGNYTIIVIVSNYGTETPTLVMEVNGQGYQRAILGGDGTTIIEARFENVQLLTSNTVRFSGLNNTVKVYGFTIRI